MSDFKVIVTILVIASVQCYENKEYNKTGQESASSWIFVDSDEDNDSRVTSASTQPTPTSPTTEPLVKDPNPCNWELPAKPNFYLPNRRISEAKCDDFQWELKNRDELIKKNEACLEYNMKLEGQEGGYNVPAIIGGRITAPGEFPHMGALGWRGVDGEWKFQCGATLISEKFLLTAAHCSSVSPSDTTIANTKPEIVRLGLTNIVLWPDDRRPYDGEIAQITVHPQYASPKKYYDIAVVEMKHALRFIDEYIQPACLWTQHDTSPLGNRAFATGWGYLDAAGTEKAVELQVAEVSIIDSVRCDALLQPFRSRHFHGLQSHQMCAGELSGGVDTCQGDSGGPLQVKIQSSKRLSYIIGVTSFGRGCARPDSPGVYTRVSSFIDWIESIVWPK